MFSRDLFKDLIVQKQSKFRKPEHFLKVYLEHFLKEFLEELKNKTTNMYIKPFDCSSEDYQELMDYINNNPIMGRNIQVAKISNFIQVTDVVETSALPYIIFDYQQNEDYLVKKITKSINDSTTFPLFIEIQSSFLFSNATKIFNNYLMHFHVNLFNELRQLGYTVQLTENNRLILS